MGADSLYNQFLLLRDSDPNFGLDSFCSDHPELAVELRRLDAQYHAAAELMERVGIELNSHAGDPVRGQLTDSNSIGLDANRYEVRGLIARGGMGQILEVYDRELRRVLALKTLLPPVSPNAAPRRESRLVNEAQILAQLDHPGIVPVHEVGRDTEGRPYFTMQRVRGDTLAVILVKSREGNTEWSVTRVVGILLRVCEAVAYAHSRGVVHRDLKPANIMVGPFGEVFVMDWGLAKARSRDDSELTTLRTTNIESIRVSHGVEVDEASSLPAASASIQTDRREVSDDLDAGLATIQGDVLGTPAYMSPEQAEGRHDEVDQRSDVYGLGAMLYHMLSGHAPYAPSASSDPREVLAEVLRGHPQALERAAPTAPRELAAVCAKGMARERSQRYESVSKLADDLRAYLEGRVVHAHRTGLIVEFWKWVRRHPGATAAVVTTILGLVAGITIQTQAKQRIEEHAQDLQEQLYFNQINQIQSAWEREDISRMQHVLASCPESLRGWEWNVLNQLSDPSILSSQEHGGDLAISPNGLWLVTSGGLQDPRHVIWDAHRLHPVGSFPTVNMAVCPVFLDSEHVVVCDTDWNSYRWPILEVPSAKEVGELQLADGTKILSVFPSPSRDLLALLCRGGELRLLDRGFADLALVDAHGTSLEPGKSGSEFLVGWAPDGARLATAGADGFLKTWDSQTLQLLSSIETGRRLTSVTWSKDGRLIATASSGSVDLFNAEGLALVRSLPAEHHDVPKLEWSPGDEYLLERSRTALRLWRTTDWGSVDIVGSVSSKLDWAFSLSGDKLIASEAVSGTRMIDLTTRRFRDLRHAGLGRTRHRVFRSDGLVFGSSMDGVGVELWDVVRQEPLPGIALKESYLVFGLSHDGERIATAGGSGKIVVWNAKSLVREFEINAHHGRINTVEFDASGSRIASAGADRWLRVFDATTGSLLWESEGPKTARWPFGVLNSRFSPDGQWIMGGASDGPLRVWRASDGQLVHELTGPSGRYSGSGAFDSSSSRVVDSGSSPTTICCWDLESGEMIWSIDKAIKTSRLTYSPDGSRIISTGVNGAVYVLDASTGTPIATIPWTFPATDGLSALSPDARRVAFIQDHRQIRFCDLLPMTSEGH